MHIGKYDKGTCSKSLGKSKGIVYCLFIQIIGYAFPNDGRWNGEIKLFPYGKFMQTFFIKIYLPVMDMLWKAAQRFFQGSCFFPGCIRVVYFKNRNSL